MKTTLADLEDLEGRLPSIEDRRPDWLKGMPSAHDSTALYYRFLYEFTKMYHPVTVLEIGTYVGTSAAHLAMGYKNTSVVTIDHNPDSAKQLVKYEVPNLAPVTADSATAVGHPIVKSCAPYDVLFIDGNHTFNQAYGEYEIYRPLLVDGAIIFFDDISLPMKTHEMEVLWEFIPDPKIRLDLCHYTGFGAAKKDPSVTIVPWKEAVIKAIKRMKELGGAMT